MNNLYCENFLVNDTNVDFTSKLSLTEIIKMLQATTFNHSNIIGLDHNTMLNKSNAFWVITKLKLKLNKNILTGDKIKVVTWTQPLSTIRAIRDFKIKLKNSVCVKAVAEWCCLDYNTRKIRKLNSICYPDLNMVENSSNNIEFSKQCVEFEAKDYIYTKTVRSTDIDINNHTNNLRYNYMAIDAFDLEELKNLTIKEYEIHFINETRLNDEIEIYKKKIKNNFYIEGRVQNKIVFKVFIKVK